VPSKLICLGLRNVCGIWVATIIIIIKYFDELKENQQAKDIKDGLIVKIKIKHFIELHFIGLFGILMFLFYVIINQLPELISKLTKYDLPTIDLIYIVLGTGLVIYEFIPKQVDYIASRFRSLTVFHN